MSLKYHIMDAMIKIIWYGQACFQINLDNVRLLIDPFSPKIGLKLPKVSADIVLVSHEHYDHNFLEPVKGEFFLIKGPGEYNIKGVSCLGIEADHGENRGKITIYRIENEDISLVHLSDLGQEELLPQQLEALGQVDILFIPVGGVYTINGKQAANIISQIEPKVVIPMHYKIPGLTLDLASEDGFLKEIGQTPPIKKELKIKKTDLPAEGLEVVILEPLAKTMN